VRKNIPLVVDSKTTVPVIAPVPTPPVAEFVEDVTCRDHTAVVPGKNFTKTWRFRNCGNSAWPVGTRIVWLSGAACSKSEAPVAEVQPGKEVDVSVELTAPSVLGRYNSFWRLVTAEGLKFGHQVWVDVIVEEEKKPQVMPTPAILNPEPKPVLPIVPVKIEPVELPKPIVIPTKIEPQKPVEVPKEKTKFEMALDQVEEMGFRERDLNIQLLIKFNGDLLKVVQELLNKEEMNSH